MENYFSRFYGTPPQVGEMESILVIIDRLWGILTSIISNHDPRFTGTFWTELFKLLGVKPKRLFKLSPHTNGQAERFNSMLEEFLRHFIDARQKNWVQMLDVAQFSFNCQQSSSTGKTPLEIVCGRLPLMPHVIDHSYAGRSLKCTTSLKSASKPLK